MENATAERFHLRTDGKKEEFRTVCMTNARILLFVLIINPTAECCPSLQQNSFFGVARNGGDVCRLCALGRVARVYN